MHRDFVVLFSLLFLGVAFLAVPPVVSPADGNYELETRPSLASPASNDVVAYGELSPSAQETVDSSIDESTSHTSVENVDDLATFRRYSYVEKDGTIYEITLINRTGELEHGWYSLAAFVFLFFSLLKFSDILTKSAKETDPAD